MVLAAGLIDQRLLGWRRLKRKSREYFKKHLKSWIGICLPPALLYVYLSPIPSRFLPKFTQS